MKCTLPELVVSKCEQFVRYFNEANNTNIPRNVVHFKGEYICIGEKNRTYIEWSFSCIIN